MKPLRPVLGALAALLLTAASAAATPATSAFTYQGLLKSGGALATGSYDFDFKLYSDSTAGSQVGSDQVALGVAVSNGFFTAALDFGAAAFDGNARWLDIQVRPAGGGSYTQLLPRQALRAVPYAVRALNGPGGSSQWLSDGPDLTYGAGGVGFLGASSPFAAGQGVFIEGGNAGHGSVFAFDYNAFQPLSLTLNGPGGSVGVGTTTPGAKFDVAGSASGLGIRATVSGSLINSTNAAIIGYGNSGGGISGTGATGVWGQSTDAEGVYGTSVNSIGVYGFSQNLDGTWGYSSGAFKSGIVGISTASTGKGGYFRNDGGGTALYSDGLAQIKTLQILGGADLAERFDAPANAEPGTVMAIDASAPGRLEVARGEYCRTVAGVVSGANGLSAGVELGRDASRAGTVPVALTGRVWVKCDAGGAPIHVGDLLTTAARSGYAMAARDRDRAPGAILGKAMTSLETGTGMVLVLVSLQ